MINKIGKIGKRNIEANVKLKRLFEDKEIMSCEIHFNSCLGNTGLTFCHRHPREWYRSCPEKLYAFDQVILGCINCHTELDDRSCTTELQKEEIFDNLRK